LKLSSAGRTIALASITVMLFVACGGGATPTPAGSTTTASTTPEGSASSAPGGSATAGGPITVGYLPKDIVNQYFAAAKTGMDKAVGETPGSKIIQVGPNEPKADL